MLQFNGQRYLETRFNTRLNNGFLIIIDTSLTIEEYIETIRRGEKAEKNCWYISVENLDGEYPNRVDREELLMILYENIGICPEFVRMEEYNNKSLIELKMFSNQLIWYDGYDGRDYYIPLQTTQEDIRNFFEMSKYSQEILRESGFEDMIQTHILKALGTLKREYKMHPEYSIDLNTYLHTLYGISEGFNPDAIAKYINFYYKAPLLSNYLIALPKGFQQKIEEILDFLDKNVKVRDELNLWVIDKEDSEQIDVALSVISKTIGNYNYPFRKEEYKDRILYLENEIEDNEENMFVAPSLQSTLQEKDATPYTFWYCPQLHINGSLDEPNMEKLQKFIDALNYEIDDYMFVSGDIYSSYYRVGFEDIDPKLLESLKQQDGSNYRIEESLETAIKQLVFKSGVLQTMGLFKCISVIEESGKKYNTQNGEIYKCESSLSHRVERRNYLGNEYRQYSIHKDKTLRSIPYYHTTLETAQDMGLITIRESKAKSIDGEILGYIEDIKLNRIEIHQGMRTVEEMFARKTLQIDSFIEIKDSYLKLRKMFETKFGRVPRIMPQMASTIKRHFEGREQEFVDCFNYKNISKIIGEKTPSMIALSSIFNWSETPKGLQEMLKCYATPTNIDTIAKNKNLILESYKNIKEKDLIALLGFMDRIDSRKIEEINEKIQEMYNTKDNSRKNELKEEIEKDIKNLINESRQEIGKLDAIKVEEEYEYRVVDNSSELLGDNICIMSGPYRAYFLNSMDYEHFSVGYDTSCCQHYDGAAEQCVVAASSSPHCGTLVIKTHDGTTKAQAFVWEALDKSGDKVLVLDNMEFANDKEVKDYLEILYAFCKESPYQTIHIGLGFNEKMASIGIPIPKDEMVCRPIIPFMDNTFDYSDYKKAIYLKKDGKVTFDLDAKYYIQKFDTPSIIETSAHGINIANDSNVLIAQHYNVYYDNCGKTTHLINKDGEIIQPTRQPLYPFEDTYINPDNHIMKWTNVEPTDFAITITRTREDTIIIKPIALDGERIPELSEKQAETIMHQIEELKEEYPNEHIVIAPASSDQLLEVQSIYRVNLMTHENYVWPTPQGDTLYNEELISLPNFNDTNSRDYDFDDLDDDEEELDEEGFEEEEYLW